MQHVICYLQTICILVTLAHCFMFSWAEPRNCWPQHRQTSKTAFSMQMHDHEYWMSLHVSLALGVEIVCWMSDWNSFKIISSLKVICAWIKFKVGNTEYNYTKQCGCSEQFVHLIVLLCVLSRGEKFALQNDCLWKEKGESTLGKGLDVWDSLHLAKGKEGRKERKKERSGTFRQTSIHIQGVPGGMCETSGECSLC